MTADGRYYSFLAYNNINENYPALEIERSKVRVNGKVIWFAEEMER